MPKDYVHRGEKINFLNNNSAFQCEFRILSFIYDSVLYMNIAYRFSRIIEKSQMVFVELQWCVCIFCWLSKSSLLVFPIYFVASCGEIGFPNSQWKQTKWVLIFCWTTFWHIAICTFSFPTVICSFTCTGTGRYKTDSGSLYVWFPMIVEVVN